MSWEELEEKYGLQGYDNSSVIINYDTLLKIINKANKYDNLQVDNSVEWEKCPRCLEDRKDDWVVPDDEWKRYVPECWWGENICLDCYLFLVRRKIESEGQGFRS